MVQAESTFTLSNKFRKNLVWHRDHDPRPYVQERASAILKVADGRAPHWVAKNGLIRPRDPDTVYSWLAIFKAEGVHGLEAHQQGGYRGYTLRSRREELQDRLRRPPNPGCTSMSEQNPQLTPCRWSLLVVRRTFEWLAGYTLSGVWRVLQTLEIEWKQGYVRLWSPDPAYAHKVRRIKKVLKYAASDPRHVVALFLDEMGYYRWPSASPDWIADTDGFPRAEHGGQDNNQQWRVIGALNACTGQVTYLQGYIIGRQQVSAFYRQLAEQYRRFEKVYLIEDNWNIHTHPEVQATLNQLPHLEVVWLPTYASWLNPIEKLWRWTRQTVLHRHRLSDRWNELKQRVASFFDQFKDGSQELLRYVGLLGDGQFAKALRAGYRT
ncbi:MAG: IS630 family transposase [Chloroflexi bacterium]|nr:IS630 family transposase [Chloroflexota bacterium]